MRWVGTGLFRSASPRLCGSNLQPRLGPSRQMPVVRGMTILITVPGQTYGLA